jgi:hypothetical protein
MGGGLLQLVAYGAQDVYLTGNPQITFFKVVYRRHTNFAMEAIQQTFSGLPNFGNSVSCQISRNGDLIHRTYLEVGIPKLTAPETYSYVNYLGLRLLKTVSIEIGGQQIDKHYSDWLYIWNELSLPLGKRYAWDTMVGADRDILNNGYGANTAETNKGKEGNEITTLYVPLEFWFCRNIGLALPLIALQYHEVKLKIDFESFANCTYKHKSEVNGTEAAETGKNLSNVNLWVDYIFLDTDERRKFAQLSHEYLIEQLQFTGQETLNSSGSRIKLSFNHPCKELIWVAKIHNYNSYWYNYTIPDINARLPFSNLALEDEAIYGYPNDTNYSLTTAQNLVSQNTGAAAVTTGANGVENKFIIDNIIPYDISSSANIYSKDVNPFDKCLLQLNGQDRFSIRNGNYFNLVQPYQHHTNIPLNRGINVYSFALKPEEHQPSGTLNMSRIDTATLAVNPRTANGTAVSGSIYIYAVNYNVLRILSGMGGLAYSN